MSAAHAAEAALASRNDPRGWGPVRYLFAAMTFAGLALWVAALAGHQVAAGWTAFLVTYGLITAGAIGWTTDVYRGTTKGIKNHGTYHRAMQRGGWAGWALMILLGAFYFAYYGDTYLNGGTPTYLRGASELVSPLAELIRGPGRGAHHWFLYGYMYCVFMAVFGVRMFLRFRHDRYQLLRTASVLLFQLAVAFFIPYFLERMHQPSFYPSYFWPLQPEYLVPSLPASGDATYGGMHDTLRHSGNLGMYFIGFAAFMTFVGTPILTYYFGKRWYCSWVCGCGGLAETAGDPFRHLSSKKLSAWRFERWAIHLVLLIVTLGTLLMWVNVWTGETVLAGASYHFRSLYGFIVVTLLSGAVGTTLYPVLGSRVWCRFFCPMAAILGLFQRYLSRFRITVNGGQCMSCGNCSTYCEMGIDVRSYAQRGANIVRASCVGCGMCSAVCPRGVLNLENGTTHADRFPGADKPLDELKKSLSHR